MTYLFFLLLFSQTLFAQVSSEDSISEDYSAGAYLIYDCEQGHWTCVVKKNFEDCQEKRTQDMSGQGMYHSCAPIGLLPTKKSCFQRQLFLITHHEGNRFCLKDSWKEKEMN